MIAAAIGKLGDAAQQERWLPQLASGAAIAGFALTEPDAGSDASAIRSTARRDGDRGCCADANSGAPTAAMPPFRWGCFAPAARARRASRRF
jgi:hypothetical protein